MKIEQKIEKFKKFIYKQDKDIMEVYEFILNELSNQDKIIELACSELVKMLGTCPKELYNVDLDCEKECNLKSYEECFIEYFKNKIIK